MKHSTRPSSFLLLAFKVAGYVGRHLCHEVDETKSEQNVSIVETDNNNKQ